MTDQERLNKFLVEQKYMTLAVTLDNGKPWLVPVRIRLHWGNAFEWDSVVTTVHSKAIKKRPDIAISIWQPDSDTTEQFGFYAEATAEQVSELGNHDTARYRAVVTKAWVNDGSFVKREVLLGE